MEFDVLGETGTKVVEQLDKLGFPGIVIVLLITAVIHLWRELRAERRRSEKLTHRLDTVSRETIIMVERITGSK